MSEGVGGSARGAELDAWLEETAAWTDGLLAGWLSDERDGAAGPLHEAMRYAALGGGKRMRPALVRLCCGALGGADADCAPAAAAVELVHAYSLVHDDLPCMDDDDLRRGRPTCHKVYGEAVAVLVGDALQAKAFEALASADAGRAAAWTAVLASAAGAAGMVGGQALDMTLPGYAADPDAVRAMHARKTAALFAAAAEMGAIGAGAGAATRVAARRFGDALGRLFQVVDDVLDVVGDAGTLGKTPGKDAAHSKPTVVAALGLEGARAEARERADEARAGARALGLADDHLALAWVERLAARRA